MTLVTVGIPTFNRPDELDRALSHISVQIDDLKLPPSAVSSMKGAARKRINTHFWQLVVGIKPPQFAS